MAVFFLSQDLLVELRNCSLALILAVMKDVVLLSQGIDLFCESFEGSFAGLASLFGDRKFLEIVIELSDGGLMLCFQLLKVLFSRLFFRPQSFYFRLSL